MGPRFKVPDPPSPNAPYLLFFSQAGFLPWQGLLEVATVRCKLFRLTRSLSAAPGEQNPIDSQSYSVQATITDLPQARRLQQFTSHSSGGWEVHDQGPSTLAVWQEPISCFVDGSHLLAVCSQGREASGVFLFLGRGTNPTMGLYPHDLI